MAFQRLTMATVAGKSADAVVSIFENWRSGTRVEEVDQFSETLKKHGASLPFVYFVEWIDRWLMGDLIPGPDAVRGRRFETTCMTSAAAIAWADQCGDQFPEQTWLASRLREAAAGWGTLTDKYVVVVLREVFDVSTADEDVSALLDRIPMWLTAFVQSGETA